MDHPLSQKALAYFDDLFPASSNQTSSKVDPLLKVALDRKALDAKHFVHAAGNAYMAIPVQRRLRKIYDHLYANASVKTPAGIASELGKVAHACAFIEKQQDRRTAFDLSAFEVRSISSSASGSLTREIAAAVRSACEEMAEAWDMYEGHAEINLSDHDIAYCIAQLEGLSFTDPKTDLMGDLFELVRSQFAKEVGGQFFTDPQVTRLAMVLLEFAPLKGDDLVDVCAGTGGFLLAGMAHLEESFVRHRPADDRSLAEFVEQAFLGVEIDPDAASAANATIKARFGPSQRQVVVQGDSLRLAEIVEREPRLRPGRHKCLATNPPFGTKITIKDSNVLRQFEVARAQPLDGGSKLRPTAPDILFLEQNLRLLDPDEGRMAIVVPYQILSGPQALNLRKWLLKRARICAVIDLPADTFQPHTGTKGALLVVSPRSQDDCDSEKIDDAIFFATPTDIGHDRRGNAIYEIDSNGKSTGNIRTDFPRVADAYRAHKAGKDPSAVYDRCFTVSTSDVLQNEALNLNAAFYSTRGDARRANKALADGGEWTFVPLKELVESIFFPGRFKRNYVGSNDVGIPFLGGSNITEFVATCSKFLAQDDPKLDALMVKEGWIVVTRSGTTGIVSTVPRAWAGYAMSEHIIRIVPDSAKIPGGYLFAVLSSEYGQDYLRRGIFGSVIDEINPEYVGNLPVPLPANSKLLEEITTEMASAEQMRSSAMATFSSVKASVDQAMKSQS